MLALRDVTHRFGRREILSAVGLAVQPGEIVGLIGPNGAGKTTALRIASTLLRPTGGTVVLSGRDAFGDLRASRRMIGYMPETPGLYDDMRVDEYLFFFCEALQLPGEVARTRVAETLADVALLEARLTTVGTLSKGTRQRLSLARAWLNDPALLLLDEPFNALDPFGSRMVRDVVRRGARAGKAFLISSHDMAELESLATRIVGIRDGKLFDRPGVPPGVWEVQLDEAADRAMACLAQRVAGLTLTLQSPRCFTIQASADTPAAALLGPLADAGVSVAAFARRSQSLEEYFLEEFGRDADLG